MDTQLTPVTNFRDLAQFGITGLTGEACAYGMRTLCDVSEEGAALLSDFFGVPGLKLNANWNSLVGDAPAIGSIMLTHDIVPKLAQFAFFRQGALAVVISGGREVQGLFDEERVQQYREFIDANPESRSHALIVNHALSSAAPMVGSRNVHQATGRSH